jgi:hypothetical protein
VARGRVRQNPVIWQARTALVWGATWFVAVQLAAVIVLEWKQPEFYDPKYGYRLRSLRERLNHDRGSPLLVILGTSRAEQGFRSSLLRGSSKQKTPVVFNLARGGSSPLLNLLTLQRLLADGIRPACVLLEIFPPYLAPETSPATIVKATLRDLPLLARSSVSWMTYAYAVRDRVLLWSKYRSGILAYWAPAWLSASDWRPQYLWDAQGGEWLAISDGVSPEQCRALTADAHRRYFRRLQNFSIASSCDRALRELLQRCREEGIAVLLFVMPESAEFRKWYAPATLERLSAYLRELQRDYRIAALVDARLWIPDDCFYDGHHLLQQGAAAFTRRFGTEILPALSSLNN